MSDKTKLKTNKLNIYLIKDFVKQYEEVVKIDDKVSKVVLKDLGIFYYSASDIYPPSWLKSFFRNDERIDESAFKSSSAKALLVIKIKHKSKDRFVAIPFGTGRFLMKDDIFEERFGLRTTLNLIDNKSLKTITKTTLSDNPRLNIEQSSKQVAASDFQIDIEKDIINSITGKSLDFEFGKFLTGKDSLSVSTKVDVTNIIDFVKKSLATYHSKKYKENFDWIDYIKDVKNSKLIASLDELVIDLLKKKNDYVWFSVPDIIDWSTIKGFKYSNKKTDKFIVEELSVDSFLSTVDLSSIAIEDLKANSITAWSNSKDSYEHSWTTYKCINAEVTYRSKCYLLDKGRWYEINKSFVSEINAFIGTIEQSQIKLLPYKHKSENEYNVAIAKKLNGLCIDANNIMYGGGHSKIECCDVLLATKELLFVKKYTSSASMSHLFSQGYVTGELLVSDPKFRNAVVNILDSKFKSVIPLETEEMIASSYTLTYVMITKKKNQQLPFFSKVNLRSFVKRLRLYGYNVKVKYVS